VVERAFPDCESRAKSDCPYNSNAFVMRCSLKLVPEAFKKITLDAGSQRARAAGSPTERRIVIVGAIVPEKAARLGKSASKG